MAELMPEKLRQPAGVFVTVKPDIQPNTRIPSLVDNAT